MDKSADLRKWFAEKWVDISRKKKGGGHPECGRDDADKGSYPKCRPQRAAARMSKKQKSYAVRAKRSKPQGVGGKPTMVATFKKKAMFNPEVNNILETLEKEAKKPGPLAGTAAGATIGGALGTVGGAIEGYREAGKDGKKGLARAKATAKGAANRAADGVVLGGLAGGAVDVGRGVNKASEKGLKALHKHMSKRMEKKASFNPEVDRILENLEKEASLRGMGVAAKRMMGSSGRKMLRTGMANPVRTAAGIGAAAGAVRGAMKPGTNPDGTQKSRLSSMARGAAAGGALGAGAGYGASKLK